MENKILEQIKKSETAMLDTLAQIVNIDSGYDALEGIEDVYKRQALITYKAITSPPFISSTPGP